MDRNNELSTLIKQLSSQNIADNANMEILLLFLSREVYKNLFSD